MSDSGLLLFCVVGVGVAAVAFFMPLLLSVAGEEPPLPANRGLENRGLAARGLAARGLAARGLAARGLAARGLAAKIGFEASGDEADSAGCG